MSPVWDQSLFVHTTIVSAAPGKVVVDAGSKAVDLVSGPPGVTSLESAEVSAAVHNGPLSSAVHQDFHTRRAGLVFRLLKLWHCDRSSALQYLAQSTPLAGTSTGCCSSRGSRNCCRLGRPFSSCLDTATRRSTCMRRCLDPQRPTEHIPSRPQGDSAETRPPHSSAGVMGCGLWVVGCGLCARAFVCVCGWVCGGVSSWWSGMMEPSRRCGRLTGVSAHCNGTCYNHALPLCLCGICL